MLTSSRLWRIAAASLALLSCNSQSGGEMRDGATSDAVSSDAPDPPDVESSAPTYTRDVRPILARSCVPCHAAGEIAPFALDTYANTQPRAADLSRAIHAGTMPPSPVDNSGACNSYRDTPSISSAEIAIVDAWIAGGSREGDPSIAAPAPPVLPTLSGDVRTISTGDDYTPSSDRADSYRCFVADAPIATGSYFVTGYGARPGNRRIVHHIIVYYPRTEAAAAMARTLDAAESGPGYACVTDSRVAATPIAAWAPGRGGTHFPDGLGVPLEGGRPIVIQVHYHAETGGTDRTEIDLEVRTSGVTPGRFVAIVNEDLNLPPHLRDVAATATLHIADVTEVATPVHLYGVFPHMHTLATAQRIEIVHPDSSHACVANVPRWNFESQRLYLYEHPVLLAPSDDISITCRYDTTSRSAPVLWGEGTVDEMCFAALFIGP